MLDLNFTYYIYCLIDPRNKKPFYIGKGKITKGRMPRYLQHLHKAKNGDMLQNPKKFNKIINIIDSGFEDLEYNFLFYTNDDIEINVKEIEYISLYRSLYDMTNLADGGLGGKTLPISPKKGTSPSEETRYKMSRAKIGKLGNRSGKKASVETKDRIKVSRSKQTGENEPRLAKLSDEKKKEIIELYNSGLGRRKISSITGIGAAAIVGFLKRNGIYKYKIK